MAISHLCLPHASPRLTPRRHHCSLRVQYKARWAGEAKSPTSPPVMVPSLKGNMVDAFDGADADAACLDIFDKQGMVKKNARDAPMLCGEISFDSAEDGMVCIEDYSSGKLRWVCE